MLTAIILSTGNQTQFHLHEGVEQEKLIYVDGNETGDSFGVLKADYTKGHT